MLQGNETFSDCPLFSFFWQKKKVTASSCEADFLFLKKKNKFSSLLGGLINKRFFKTMIFEYWYFIRVHSLGCCLKLCLYSWVQLPSAILLRSMPCADNEGQVDFRGLCLLPCGSSWSTLLMTIKNKEAFPAVV